MRASPAWRAAIPVFEPQPAPLAALAARLKEQFDPKGILNPGRMVSGRRLLRSAKPKRRGASMSDINPDPSTPRKTDSWLELG